MIRHKAMLLTVGTGRDRQDIAGMLLDSIRNQNPTRVIFAASRQTADETVPLILPKLDYLGTAVTTLVLDNENDVEACVLQIRRALHDLAKEIPRDAIVIDYTSGTKPMSAAAFFSAMAEGIPTVMYMEGKRDTTGRVIPGMQTPRQVRPVTLFADMAQARGTWLFDHHHYAAAIELFQQQRSYSFCPDNQRLANLFLALAQAYEAWDRFNFDAAWNAFENIKPARDLLKTLPCADAVHNNQQALHHEKSDEYSVWRLADLFNNARRRAAQAAYDDAVLRLYRAYEFMAQIVLWHQCNHLETKAAPYAELPPHLRSRYQHTAETGRPVMLGARDAYELLKYKCPHSPLAALMDGEQGLALSRALTARNDSVLAHGFQCVPRRTYDKLFEMLLRAAQQTWPREFDRACEHTTFPSFGTLQGCSL